MKLKTVEVEKLLEEKLQWHHEMNAKDQLLKETQIKLDELMGQTREMDQWQSQIRQLEAERPILMAQIGVNSKCKLFDLL